MLRELTICVRRDAAYWHPSDHAGVVGAMLCWEKRRMTVAKRSGFENRYEETTSSWERELEQLAEAGVRKFWQ
jgi:hypothetical protein